MIGTDAKSETSAVKNELIMGQVAVGEGFKKVHVQNYSQRVKMENICCHVEWVLVVANQGCLASALALKGTC